jgi:hypothetical protein
VKGLAMALLASGTVALLLPRGRDPRLCGGTATGASAAGQFESADPVTALEPATPVRTEALTDVALRASDPEGRPIEGADVFVVSRVLGDRGAGRRSAVTDEIGSASLSLPPTHEPYLILVNWHHRTLADRTRAAVEATVDGGDRVDLHVVLEPLEGSLDVQVTDDVGQPIENALVQVNHEARTARTDRNGIAVFAHLPARDLPVDIELPAEVAVMFGGAHPARQTARLASRHVTRLAFVAERAGSLEVALPADAAAAGAEVELMAGDGYRRWIHLRQSAPAQGTVTFTSLPTGRYWVSARCAPGSSWNCPRRDLVAVASGSAVKHELRLAREPGVFSGTVVDENFRPVPRAPVCVFRIGSLGASVGAKLQVTGEDGCFAFRGMPAVPLLYVIDVESMVDGNFRSGGEQGEPFRSVPGPTESVLVRLLPGHRLLGKVVNRDSGNPVAAVAVYMQRRGSKLQRRAYSRSDQRRPRPCDSVLDVGWFEFANLAPGTYDVWCGDNASPAGHEVTFVEGPKAAPDAQVVLHL